MMVEKILIHCRLDRKWGNVFDGDDLFLREDCFYAKRLRYRIRLLVEFAIAGERGLACFGDNNVFKMRETAIDVVLGRFGVYFYVQVVELFVYATKLLIHFIESFLHHGGKIIKGDWFVVVVVCHRAQSNYFSIAFLQMSQCSLVIISKRPGVYKYTLIPSYVKRCG